MKRNLIVLLLLTTVASVVARLNHNREVSQAREQARMQQDAFVQDLQNGLQQLWGQYSQTVSFHDAVLTLQVQMPSQADPSWNQALAGYLLKLHPGVKIDRVEVGGINPQRAPEHLTQESELATRQAQSQLDSLLGPDQALALVDVRLETKLHQQTFDASGPGPNGSIIWRCGVGPTTSSKEKVRHIYFVQPTSLGTEQKDAVRKLLRPNAELEEEVTFVSWR